jgi:hypothetical protein
MASWEAWSRHKAARHRTTPSTPSAFREPGGPGAPAAAAAPSPLPLPTSCAPAITVLSAPAPDPAPPPAPVPAPAPSAKPAAVAAAAFFAAITFARSSDGWEWDGGWYTGSSRSTSPLWRPRKGERGRQTQTTTPQPCDTPALACSHRKTQRHKGRAHAGGRLHAGGCWLPHGVYAQQALLAQLVKGVKGGGTGHHAQAPQCVVAPRVLHGDVGHKKRDGARACLRTQTGRQEVDGRKGVRMAVGGG